MVGSGRPTHPGGTVGSKAGGGKGATTVVDVEREKVAKEEARRRTLTDFRIVGLEIKALGWKWGVVRPERGEDEDEDEDEDDDGEEEERKSEAGIKDKGEEGAPNAKNESETAADEAEVERDIIKTEPVAEDVVDPVVQVEVKVEETAVGSTVDETQAEPDTVILAPNPDLASEETIAKDAEQTTVATGETPASAAQEANDVDKEQTKDSPVVVASANTIEGKRGEKRKAKMSSPDAGLSRFLFYSARLLLQRFAMWTTF
jgi:hypothetical protein